VVLALTEALHEGVGGRFVVAEDPERVPAIFFGTAAAVLADDDGADVDGALFRIPRVGECGGGLGELGDSGRTARAVAAPLTAEQRAQRAADEQRRKEQERALNEQKRKDQALLNTYGSPKDIEVMRSRAERDLAAAIRASEEKIGEILKQRKRFEDEAEFYRNRPLPAEVVKGLRDADNEIRSQESVIESKKKDQEAIRLKYDEDLRRFLELSQRAPARP